MMEVGIRIGERNYLNEYIRLIEVLACEKGKQSAPFH